MLDGLSGSSGTVGVFRESLHWPRGLEGFNTAEPVKEVSGSFAGFSCWTSLFSAMLGCDVATDGEEMFGSSQVRDTDFPLSP